MGVINRVRVMRWRWFRVDLLISIPGFLLEPVAAQPTFHTVSFGSVVSSNYPCYSFLAVSSPTDPVKFNANGSLVAIISPSVPVVVVQNYSLTRPQYRLVAASSADIASNTLREFALSTRILEVRG